MRVVAVAALHGAFEHLVMKRQQELMFCFTVTAQTELRFTLFQQADTGKPRLLRVRWANKYIGAGDVFGCFTGMR